MDHEASKDFILFRPQSAKEKEYLSSIKLVTYRNGKAQQKIIMSKIMSVKDIFLILFYLEDVNLI